MITMTSLMNRYMVGYNS